MIASLPDRGNSSVRFKPNGNYQRVCHPIFSVLVDEPHTPSDPIPVNSSARRFIPRRAAEDFLHLLQRHVKLNPVTIFQIYFRWRTRPEQPDAAAQRKRAGEQPEHQQTAALGHGESVPDEWA